MLLPTVVSGKRQQKDRPVKHVSSTLLVAIAIAALPAQADARDQHEGLFDFSIQNWFATVETQYIDSSGDARFVGTTASVYGGTPSIKMDDGLGMSLGLGFETTGGWRFSGDIAYLSTNSRTNAVFGVDDRADDTFILDAEVESVVFMLKSSFDFDIGLDRLTPFLKGGIGVARNESKNTLLDVYYDSLIWNGTSFDDLEVSGISYPGGSTTDLAWSIGAGIRMALSERLELSMAYGYTDLGEAVTGTNAGGDALAFDDLISQQVQIGLELRF
jgi:opacity protein-like surface antigen